MESRQSYKDNVDKAHTVTAPVMNGIHAGSMMETTSFLISDNAEFVEALYRQYLADPTSVSEEWRDYFADLSSPSHSLPEKGNGVQPQVGSALNIEQQARVLQLIHAYRVRGHLNAHLDPLNIFPR